jgi:hypothetical protein
MRFTKEHLTKKGLRRRDITIPDTEGVISIRELSTAEVRDFAERFKQAENSGDKQLDATMDLVIHGVVDEHGKQMFEPSDSAELLKSMSAATVTFIAGQISKLSGMSSDDAADDQKKDATN